MPSPRSSPKPAAELDHDWSFDALGTRWVISTPSELPESVVAGVSAELDRIDQAWSRFRGDSMVAEMSRRSGRFDVDLADQPLLDWYRRLYDTTSGAVSPLVGQTLVDAGYDARYSLTPSGVVATVPAWDDVILSHRGGLTLAVPAVIDVGAAGKGFAVDRVVEIVASSCDEYIVDGGGDMRISADRLGVRVALEHPLNPANAIGVVTVDGGAVCASASNRRVWADWHHIVDPRSGSPAREVLATWVIVPDGPWATMIADGLATALFFTPATALRGRPALAGNAVEYPDFEHLDFEYVVVRRNGSVEHSSSARLELFL